MMVQTSKVQGPSGLKPPKMHKLQLQIFGPGLDANA
jgi:hypothetical protein